MHKSDGSKLSAQVSKYSPLFCFLVSMSLSLDKVSLSIYIHDTVLSYPGFLCSLPSFPMCNLDLVSCLPSALLFICKGIKASGASTKTFSLPIQDTVTGRQSEMSVCGAANVLCLDLDIGWTNWLCSICKNLLNFTLVKQASSGT